MVFVSVYCLTPFFVKFEGRVCFRSEGLIYLTWERRGWTDEGRISQQNRRSRFTPFTNVYPFGFGVLPYPVQGRGWSGWDGPKPKAGWRDQRTTTPGVRTRYQEHVDIEEGPTQVGPSTVLYVGHTTIEGLKLRRSGEGCELCEYGSIRVPWVRPTDSL